MVSVDDIRSVSDEIAQQARLQLHRKIERAVLAAFREGKDFVHTSPQVTSPDPFDPRPLFEHARYAVEVRGGAVEAGREWPQDFMVYRVADLTEGERARLAAGRDDWRENDWEDGCGLPGCTICYACREG